ncbi:MFS transporter [Ktedonosporobacter rubrisoli]|uniref:MFS transporter n=1 Tax=Ktedonosporobacter rubrisoli TaxID=2509675 RepID=A0A4P6JLN2_KTERU|nr:MFS transporter [Ktedonosporobacter rubrisoli]QBD76115.1 MFS transporter [Ktedonosporobacter rubrisoli]
MGASVSDQLDRANKPGSKAMIFLIVLAFLNTVGMTIANPVVPFMTQQHLSNPNDLALTVALMISLYGICQLLASPVLGLLSDSFGRRPVLFVCLIGSALGYLLFGLAGALWLLFVGRIIDGLTGGNVSVLFAYIADTTRPEERGKYFGIIGGVSGLGVIIGPSVGGLLAGLNYSAPFIAAAAVCTLSLLWGIFFLPESLPRSQRVISINVSDLNPLKQLGSLFRVAHLRWLLLAFFFYFLPFAHLIANLAILLKDGLGWNAAEAGLASSIIGVIDILVQGVLVGLLLPIFGNVKLGNWSLALVGISYVLLGIMALTNSPILLIAGGVLFAGASGLVENSLRGLTSSMASANQQGVISGASQSMESLAMIVGPLLGGWLYSSAGHAVPYLCGTVIIVLAIVSVLRAVAARPASIAPAKAEAA